MARGPRGAATRSPARRALAAGGAGVLTAALAALAVADAPPASGGSARPSATDGYVSYSAPQLSVTCKGDTLTAITFGFGYDASALKRSYDLALGAYALAAAADAPPAQRVTIAAGTTGSVQRVFTVTGGPSGTGVYASARSTSGSDYDYVSIGAVTDVCLAPHTITLTPPKVAAGGVDCADTAAITVDGAAADQDWSWLLFPQWTGGYQSGATRVAPGASATITETGVAPGDRFGLKFTGQGGSVDVGQFALGEACPHRKQVSLAPVNHAHAHGTQRVSVHVADRSGADAASLAVRFAVTGRNHASGTVRTDAHGDAVFSYRPRRTGHDTVTATTDGGVASLRLKIAKRLLRAHLAASSRGVGRVTLTMRLAPRLRDARVFIYRLVNRRWAPIASVRTGRDGTKTRTLRLTPGDELSLRARADDPRYADRWSRTATVTVRF